MAEVDVILGLIVGMIIGIIMIYAVMKSRSRNIETKANQMFEQQKDQLREQIRQTFQLDKNNEFERYRETLQLDKNNEFERYKETIQNEKNAEIEKFKAEYENVVQERIDKARADTLERSRVTLKGRIAEQMAPLLPEFIAKYLPSDARFIGNPIDYVIFKNMTKNDNTADEPLEIVFLEVKTGSSNLTSRENKIKKAIEAQRVSFETLKPNSEIEQETETETPVISNKTTV